MLPSNLIITQFWLIYDTEVNSYYTVLLNNLPWDDVPEARWGVSGIITCWDDRVLRVGVGASEDERDDGRLDGVDIVNQFTSTYWYFIHFYNRILITFTLKHKQIDVQRPVWVGAKQTRRSMYVSLSKLVWPCLIWKTTKFCPLAEYKVLNMTNPLSKTTGIGCIKCNFISTRI